MDLHGNPQIVCGRFKQILTQFMLKSLHIILGSRVPSIRRYDHQGEVKKSDKWFNLVFRGRPASLENLDFWQRNLMEPMLIDIILAQETPNSSSDHNFHASSGLGTTDTILERWVVQYEHLGMMAPQTSDASDQKVHTNFIILLRSLYSMLRLLPAYKAFQKLSSSSKTICFGIKYKVSVFGTPFSSAEEDLMKQYSFVPVDAQQGRVSISVTYRKSLSDFNLETPAVVLPKIITEYVGSHPNDALRVLSSSLEKGFHGTSLSSRGMLSPSTPFQLPHGWTNGLDSVVSFPSPPTHLCGEYTAHACLRAETALVSIPHPMMRRNSRFLSPILWDPNRQSLPPVSPRYRKHDLSSQEYPSRIRSLRKPEALKSGDSNCGIRNLGQKVSGDAREDTRWFSGLLSSSSSPCVGFSRRSRRLSFQDDSDEGHFFCPFAVDDVDTTESRPSENFGGRKGSEASAQALPMARQSQDSAIGALVCMLRTAPPLRQDSGCYASDSSTPELEADGRTSQKFFLPLTTSDALEELRVYKDMKEFLLSMRAAQASRNAKTPSH